MPRDGERTPPPDWKLILSPDDVALLCGVSRERVSQWLAAGDLRAFRSGDGTHASWYIPRATLTEDLADMATRERDARHHGKVRVIKREA